MGFLSLSKSYRAIMHKNGLLQFHSSRIVLAFTVLHGWRPHVAYGNGAWGAWEMQKYEEVGIVRAATGLGSSR